MSRVRSTSSVAPSLPTSSSSVCEEKHSSTSYTSTPMTKQVCFADDRGAELECVHVIPIQPTTRRKAFHETLEEVYINEDGVVTGFLRISNLEPGRKVIVRYTENEWKTFKEVLAYNSEDSMGDRNFWKSTKTKDIRSHRNAPWNKRSKDDVLKYSFNFSISRRMLSRVELVVISTVDGTIDHRHEQRYKLNHPQSYLGSVTYGHCVHCWH